MSLSWYVSVFVICLVFGAVMLWIDEKHKLDDRVWWVILVMGVTFISLASRWLVE